MRGVATWLALVCCAAGCGGGGGGRPGAGGAGGQPPDAGGPAPSCGNVPPCGGAVAGEWTIQQQCDSAAHVAAAKADFATNVEPTWCAIATLLGISSEASGTVRFDAAGTYALDLAFGGSLNVNYPMSCLVSFNCDDLTAELQSEIAAGTYPVPSATSVSCSGSSSCLCHVAVSASRAESGTYATAGSLLVLTASSGAITSKGFCVQGNTLHILDASTSASGQTTVDSDVVATKP